MHEKNAKKLDTGDDSGEYKVEAIQDSVVYAGESELGHKVSTIWFHGRDIQRKRIPGS